MLDPILLQIAKTAILHEFNNSYTLDKESLFRDYPFLKKEGATFVTIEHSHHLRGCIGSIIAHRSLYDDLVQNAVSAAFHDPRFHPLNEREFSNISLEVSVLSQPEILEYDDFDDLLTKVNPDIDGLILNHNGHQGTFLPQVWEQIKSPKEFLEHLSIKAGLTPLVYQEHPTIYRYHVDAIEKKFDDILSL